MNIPKLKKVTNISNETKLKVEKIIKETLEVDYFKCYPIEDFTIEEIDVLSEYAGENDVIIFLRAEHSNYYQGTLVELLRKVGGRNGN